MNDAEADGRATGLVLEFALDAPVEKVWRAIEAPDLIPGLVVRRREPGGGAASGPREVHPAHEIPSRRYAAVRRDAAVVAHVTVEEVLS